MSTCNHIPGTPAASLDARLALEDLDVETSRAVAPCREHSRRSMFNDLKLLFAALGAGGSVVPMGDNRRAASLLAGYAASLRDR
jgi:hypothetical protein